MRPIFAIPILLCGLVLAGACGKASDPGIPSANPSASTSAGPSAGRGDLVPFARCMREHGMNVPDPDPGQDLAWQEFEHAPGFDPAWSACRHLMPPAPDGQDTALPTEELEALRAFAVCMRAHDIDMSDPDPTGNMTIGGRLAALTRAQLENDPGYKAGYEACRDKLPVESGKEER